MSSFGAPAPLFVRRWFGSSAEATHRQHVAVTVLAGLLAGFVGHLKGHVRPEPFLDAALGATAMLLYFLGREYLSPMGVRAPAPAADLWDSRRDWTLPGAAALCFWAAFAVAALGPYGAWALVFPGIAIDLIRKDRKP